MYFYSKTTCIKIRKSIVALLLSIVFSFSVIPVSAVEPKDNLNVWDDNNIPVVYLNIDEGAEGFGTIAQMNESKDHTSKCTGTMKIDVPDGYYGDYSKEELTDTDDLKMEYIRGRGNTTWEADKKPYKIKLSKKADLLGMGKNKHWVLLANRLDNTLLKNRLMCYMGTKMGLEFTPKMLPVDVVMNGEYLGNYYLSEHIRIGSSRVDIDELTAADNQEPEITGGYLLGLSPDPFKINKDNIFKTSRNQTFSFESPEFYSDDGDTVGTAEQKAYISSYLQKTEDAIFADDFKDKDGVSYSEYMDIRSAADYWWIQEFSLNEDAFCTPSSYLYKKRNGKLYWGPLWDFDSSMGNISLSIDDWNFAWMIWLDRLREFNPEYQQLLRDRWVVFDSIITDIVKDGGIIDKYASEIKNSYADDYEKWGTYESVYYPRFDLETEVGNLKRWLTERQRSINKNIGTQLTHLFDYITFEADGKVIDTQKISVGSILYEYPKMPKKKGMIFVGWIDKKGKIHKETDPFTEEYTTLTAKYVKESEPTEAQKLYFDNYDVWVPLFGMYYQTRYSYTPFYANEYSVNWSSSNSNIATVDSDGVVNFRTEGDVVITGTLKSGYSNSYKLHILDKDITSFEDCTSVYFSKQSLTLRKEQYGQVSVSVKPDLCYYQTVYSSADPAIADVDENGVVYAKNVGTTQITVTEKYSQKTAVYNLTVLPEKESVPMLNKTKLSLKSGQTATLKVSNGKAKSWSSSNSKIATVKNGKVTALKKGSVTVTATLTTGKKLTCKVKVSSNPSIKIGNKKYSKKTVYTVKKGKKLTVKISGKASAVNNKYSTTNKKIAKVTSKTSAQKIIISTFKMKGKATITLNVNGINFPIKIKVK